jgi:hypothetical protein
MNMDSRQHVQASVGRSTRLAAMAVAAVVGFGTSLVAYAATKTYTLTADFNTGTVIGVNTAGDKLELSATGSTFPVLWIANAGEDTLTKFDTVNNKELARYRTWFGPAGQTGHVPHLGNAFAGAAPSRTAVDLDGNAYVVNRHFDGRSAVIIKVLSSGFVDRNGNGVVDTSSDANADGIIDAAEMKNLADTNSNGIIDPSEIQDERIAWALRVPDGIAAPVRTGALGRALCIAPNGNLWVGLFSDQTYYEVRGSDGKTLRGPISVGVTPYGCLVDGAGKLWSANLGAGMGRLDTIAGTSQAAVSLIDSTYGIAIDQNYVYFASQSSSSYLRVNKTTLAQDRPAQGPRFFSVGISVDGDGNIATGYYQGGGITKYKAADGSVICSATGYPNMSETRGVIADAQGNIWQISVSGNLVAKYSKTCAKLGTFPVGNAPYTYSDAAGLAARTITTRTGDWNVVYDATTPATPWGTVNWNATLPADSSLVVSVRAADSLVNLGAAAFSPVSSGVAFPATGRFLEVQTRLTASTGGLSPVVFDLTLASKQQVQLACDINTDGSVNSLDIGLITAARNTTAAPGDARDINKDGLINIVDSRQCALQCTKPNCAR